MDKSEAESMLELIETRGAVDLVKRQDVSVSINPDFDSLLDRSSGSPRLRRSVRQKFILIAWHPKALSHLSPLTIRCSCCGRIISYPAWHYMIHYSGNEFHYFICYGGETKVQLCRL